MKFELSQYREVLLAQLQPSPGGGVALLAETGSLYA
jgi:hypothetical protein